MKDWRRPYSSCFKNKDDGMTVDHHDPEQDYHENLTSSVTDMPPFRRIK